MRVDGVTYLSSPALINKGVPQSRIRGPLLLLIYINDQSELLSTDGVSPFIYADDINLLLTSDSVTWLPDDISRAMGKAEAWCRENRLCLQNRVCCVRNHQV